VDQVGGSTCIFALSTICFVGHFVSSIGVHMEVWATVIAGCLVLGIGFESLFVAIEAFLANWFESGELGWALGVSAAAGSVGELLTFILSPLTANEISVAFAFWLGAIISSVSL